MRLKGKVALVTGAGQGIGRAVALILAKEGADIIINGRSLETVERVAGEIRSLGRQTLAIRADVSKSNEVKQMVKEALDSFGKIDILVNNAGVTERMPTIEMTESLWVSVIDINLKGEFLCCQVVGREMIKRRQGKIVNIASVAAHVAVPGMAAYGASKAGVLQLTRVLAVEWGKYNINVNAVSPGMTLTAMWQAARAKEPQFFEAYVERSPLRRFNKPEDIGNAVLFLASSESDNITGQEITVDMGICALHPGYVWPKD